MKILGAAGTGLAGIVTIYKHILHPFMQKVLEGIDNIYSMKKIIEKELQTNGGSSMKDAIKRIDRSNSIQDGRHHAALSLKKDPIWEADADGNYIWVNSAYVKETGFDIEHLKNRSWLITVSDKDRDRVKQEWEDCVRYQTVFECDYNLECVSETKKVRCLAHPIISDYDKKIVGYVGVLEPV